MFLLIAYEMFSCVDGISFFSGYESRKWKFPLYVHTILVNEPEQYWETIAILCAHMKRTQEMLFADWAP